MVRGSDMHVEMPCAESGVPRRAGRGGVAVLRSARMPEGGRGVEEEEEGLKGLLTGDLGLDAGLVVGAEQLSLDGLHHPLEASAGTWGGERSQELKQSLRCAGFDPC